MSDRTRSAMVMVGHDGPRTGGWWIDETGTYDEFELATKTAGLLWFELDARGWRTGFCSSPRAYPAHLHDKGLALDKWQPEIGVEIHFGIFSTDRGARDRRWPGVESSVFAKSEIPVQNERASGLSVVYLEKNDSASRAADAIITRATEFVPELGLALGTGHDPRPLVGNNNKPSVWITKRVDPEYRPRRFYTHEWPGCPVILLETAVLTHPHDRALLRGDPFFLVKIAHAVAAALDDWRKGERDRQEAEA